MGAFDCSAVTVYTIVNDPLEDIHGNKKH
jgi:hypothetical protein